MKLKVWADALQGFILRALSSFFLTYLAVVFELYSFAITHETHDLKCTIGRLYWVFFIQLWACFHLLLYRKDMR